MDVLAWFDGGALVALLALGINGGLAVFTYKRGGSDVHRADRLGAYRDFLTACSKRMDGYRRFEDAGEADRAAALRVLNERRHEVFEALAVIQLVGSPDVVRAALAYNRRLSLASPTRRVPKPMPYPEQSALMQEFIRESRADLGREAKL